MVQSRSSNLWLEVAVPVTHQCARYQLAGLSRPLVRMELRGMSLMESAEDFAKEHRCVALAEG